MAQLVFMNKQIFTEYRSVLTGKKLLKIKKFLTPILDQFFSAPGVFYVSLLIYLKTMAPGVFGYDSAELATGVYSLGIVHPPGYPLYLLLGKLFSYIPVGDLAYRLNLMSALFASLTAVILFKLLVFLFHNRVIAWVSVLVFAFSNYYWQMALVAEVYTLHTFFLILNLYILIQWQASGKKVYLFLFALLYGLSMSNHTSGILFAPGFAWLVISAREWRWKKAVIYLPLMFLLFLSGLSVYLYLPLRFMASPPLNYIQTYYGKDLTKIPDLYWMISGQAYRFFAFAYTLAEIPSEILRFFTYLWRNFLGVGVILGLAGFYPLVKHNRKITLALVLLFLGNIVFYVNYRVVDKDTMFLPAYLIWSVFIASGLLGLYLTVKREISKRNLFPQAELLFRGVILLIVGLEIFLNWGWVDLSKTSGPQIFAEEVLQTSADHAFIMVQWSPAVILEYYQIVEGKRTDLVIYNRSRSQVAEYYHLWQQGFYPEEILEQIKENELELVRQTIEEGPVYVVEYDPLFANEYEYLPEGNYFELRTRGGTDT